MLDVLLPLVILPRIPTIPPMFTLCLICSGTSNVIFQIPGLVWYRATDTALPSLKTLHRVISRLLFNHQPIWSLAVASWRLSLEPFIAFIEFLLTSTTFTLTWLWYLQSTQFPIFWFDCWLHPLCFLPPRLRLSRWTWIKLQTVYVYSKNYDAAYAELAET